MQNVTKSSANHVLRDQDSSVHICTVRLYIRILLFLDFWIRYMTVTFTPHELALINHALSSYQHNNSFRGVSAKVEALVTKFQPDQPKAAPLSKIKQY
jgi:hypothetical protein|tara:strand:+ start:471 stop:764 length:294 start_codon:yes stop_codon:yes gene_type:complete